MLFINSGGFMLIIYGITIILAVIVWVIEEKEGSKKESWF